MKKLSKSEYVQGLTCLNYVWYKFNDRSKIPEIKDKFIMERGTETGILAQKLFPEGIEVPSELKDYKRNPKETQKLLKEGKPLFEAGFETDKLYCRVDILVPTKNGYDIIEVKSGTKVKNEHKDDVAFQRYVLEKNGLKVNKCYLMHTNNKYVRKGKLDLSKLFEKDNITKDVNERMRTVGPNIDMILKYVSKKLPSKHHKYCSNPRNCDVRELCWAHLPEHHIFELNGLRFDKATTWMDEGYLSILDLPDEFLKSHKHVVHKKVVSDGKKHVNLKEVERLKKKLVYPHIHMDFETLNLPVPPYDNVKPWEKIPFQYSLHVDDGKDIKHYEYLADSDKDPRREFTEGLVKNVPSSGSVIVFNQSFEKSILKRMIELFPKHEKKLKSIIDRLVDLQTIFKQFHYYHVSQKGSASLKSVLPALTDISYSSLEIGNGTEAYTAFYDKYYLGKKGVSRKALLDYCKMDTWAMVEILREI